MFVGELKELLVNVPDDYVLWVEDCKNKDAFCPTGITIDKDNKECTIDNWKDSH